MSLPSENSNAQEGYILRQSDPRPEWSLLDEQHAAWNEWMGGVLSFAPIQEPKTILELGSGTGAWAIQASSIYPDATITAVDILDTPPRRFPSNVRYTRHNLTQVLPFESGSFDVVHNRLVLSHLPQPERVLQRMIQFTRPGGWFLVEDVCFNHEPSAGNGEIQTMLLDFRAFTEGEKGIDNAIGRKLVDYIRRSELFDTVEEKFFVITRGKSVDDPGDQRFAEFNRRRFKHAMQTIHQNIVAGGKIKVHDIDFENLWDETDDCPFASLHFVWAHRKIESAVSESGPAS